MPNIIVTLLASEKIVQGFFLPKGEGYTLRRLIFLVALSMITMLILAPAAMANEHGKMEEQKMEEKSKMGMDEKSKMEEKSKMDEKKEMPKTGGPALGSLLPVGGLLIASGIMAFAVLRRR